MHFNKLAVAKTLKSILRPIVHPLTYRVGYPLLEKCVSSVVRSKRFRSYMINTDRFNIIADQVLGIDSQRRLRVRHIEVDIVKGCNFKCKYCSHVSPFRKGFVPLEELTSWFETWSKKTVPDEFALLGGEPLLHPQLAEVIATAGECFKDSQLQLVTNAFLIKESEKMDRIWEALRQTKALVIVSKHFNNKEYNEKFDESIRILAGTGIPFVVRDSHKTWGKAHKMEKGLPMPFQSDFREAWKHGCTGKTCFSIRDNDLYFCSVLSSLSGAVSEGVVPKEWEVVNGYKPLTPDSSLYEMFSHLHSDAIPVCSICPEKIEITVPEMIN